MIFKKNNVVATKIQWTAPTVREDGSTYSAAQHAGYELGVSDPANPTDGFAPFVSVPAAYNVTEWLLNNLNIGESDTYEVALRTVDTDGLTSAWSNSMVFTAENARPNAPDGFNVL